MAKYKTLQNPWAEGLGNDYEQNLSYVVEYVKKDATGKLVPATKGEKGAKSTWRDGIYTKLAQDVKDPMGLNKRTVNLPQAKWGDEFDTIPASAYSAMSGETDGSALFTSGYATAVSFGRPFTTDMDTAMANFVDAATGNDATGADYYEAPSGDKLKVPQGFEVASFRQVTDTSEN